MEDTDGACELCLVFARTDLWRLAFGFRARVARGAAGYALSHAVLACLHARLEDAVFRALRHVPVDVKSDCWSVLVGALLFRRCRVGRALVTAA